jgi:hypothetical protein
MPGRKKQKEWRAVARAHLHGIPLDELEARLEMQRMAPMDPAVACYADYCPEDCAILCGSGYAACTDLCACDGTMCAAECGSLCVADSCLVDIL